MADWVKTLIVIIVTFSVLTIILACNVIQWWAFVLLCVVSFVCMGIVEVMMEQRKQPKRYYKRRK